jgi:MFS transporter, PAT family, solute carrier family 33 (acetyl-CoA transportor), member 1
MLFVAKVGWAAHDAASALKYVEKGLGKEDFAVAVLTDFPIQIIFGYYVARWSRGDRPLRPWLLAYWPRFMFAFLAAVILWNFPAPPVTTGFFIFLVIFRSLGEMARFVRPTFQPVFTRVFSFLLLLQYNTIHL